MGPIKKLTKTPKIKAKKLERKICVGLFSACLPSHKNKRETSHNLQSANGRPATSGRTAGPDSWVWVPMDKLRSRGATIVHDVLASSTNKQTSERTNERTTKQTSKQRKMRLRAAWYVSTANVKVDMGCCVFWPPCMLYCWRVFGPGGIKCTADMCAVRPCCPCCAGCVYVRACAPCLCPVPTGMCNCGYFSQHVTVCASKLFVCSSSTGHNAARSIVSNT